MKSKKAKLKTPSLKALNDIYIIQEDGIDFERDDASGMTPEVVAALQSKKLYVPDTAEYYAKKYPFRGVVVQKGDLCKKYPEVTIGTRVMYAPLGVVRYKVDDKRYCNVRECDLHATLG